MKTKHTCKECGTTWKSNKEKPQCPKCPEIKKHKLIAAMEEAKKNRKEEKNPMKDVAEKLYNALDK